MTNLSLSSLSKERGSASLLFGRFEDVKLPEEGMIFHQQVSVVALIAIKSLFMSSTMLIQHAMWTNSKYDIAMA